MLAEPPVVSFRGVEKRYAGGAPVVRDLDLDVRRGEFLTLLGPSGSGKTTTLMMLAGFEQPSAGEIRLGGRSLARVPPHKRGIGMVFQDYALFPHMDVHDNVAYPLRVRRRPRAEIAARVAAALNLVELTHTARRQPGTLSGGQRQRVALARAVVFEPEILLMDEPLGALDRQLRDRMQVEVRRIQRQLGLTAISVTHDQSEALTMSDRIAVFHGGRIQQIGPARELYEQPCNSFVACFVGETNALTGIVDRVDGNTCRVRLESGDVIVARAVAIGGRAVRTTVSIRPERLLAGEAARGLPNLWAGEVVGATYGGDHTRLRVRALGRDDLVVKLGVAGQTYAPGDMIDFGCHPDHCRALDPVP